ncbi:bifunctional phosphoserine phosphatase/homoserine phosphotransferase ThrH [candidate division KSB1 bacterium]|nr:bifunctional phosphoserine phosphatase/homoserine phosphotransferase ThrH [candidate division KSB1 bacterium]
MKICCFDLEGVFTPEVWINVALRTGIDDLKLTTRDISDYNVLMKRRLGLLNQYGISLKKIQDVIAGMDLLPGAREFLDWVRTETQVIILSDTFEEFGMPFMKKLGYPTLFCHNLEVGDNGMITDYKIRIPDHKRESVVALKKLNYEIIAAGDSYNDTSMLKEAHHGILFRPPQNVSDEFPQFPVATDYGEFKALLSEKLEL